MPNHRRTVRELEKEVITNQGKDYFIEQLKAERGYVERLMDSSRQIGELQTKLLQLGTRRSGGEGDYEGKRANGV